MASKSSKTPREQAIEQVYSKQQVTLDRCRTQIEVAELSTERYPELAKLIGGFGLSVLKFAGITPQQAQAGEAGLRSAGVTDERMGAAVIDSLMGNLDALCTLAQWTVTGLGPQEIKALHMMDKLQLVEAMLDAIHVSDVARFFRLTAKLTSVAAAVSPPTGS